MRASTGHLRNLSGYNRGAEGIELPNIKHATKDMASSRDLEEKLRKLKTNLQVITISF